MQINIFPRPKPVIRNNPLPTLSYQKRAIELSTEATYLVITLDFKLNWATHINIYQEM